MNPDDALMDRLRAKTLIPAPATDPTAVHFKTWIGYDIFEKEDRDSDGGLYFVYFAIHTQTGERHDIDVSPYYPDWRLVCRVVDLGFPKRIGPSPLTQEDCDRIEANRLTEHPA